MKQPWFVFLVLSIFFTSCLRTTHLKLDQANRTTSFYKRASSVALQIADAAYTVSDTTSLKILIERVAEANCKNNDWRSILNKLNHEVNIIQTTTLSLDKMKKYCDSMQEFKKYDEENYNIIKENREVLFLMKDGIIRYDFEKKSFFTSSYHPIIDLLSYADIINGQKIADIGSGINNVGLFAGILFPDSDIYINELDTNLLSSAKNRMIHYDHLLNQERMHFIKGDSMSIQIEEKMDLIIMRKTLHHFQYPNQMLESIRNTLEQDGSLIVFEAIPRRKRKASQCKKLMKQKAVLKILKMNEFTLTKSKVNRSNMYLIYQPSKNIR